MYGRPPTNLLSYVPSTARIEAVENELIAWDEVVKEFRENILLSQSRMKFYADKKRRERSFEVGEWVYLRLQPYRHLSVALRRKLKLSPRFLDLSRSHKKLVLLPISLNCQKIPRFTLCFMFPTLNSHLATITSRVLPCQKFMVAVVLWVLFHKRSWIGKLGETEKKF